MSALTSTPLWLKSSASWCHRIAAQTSFTARVYLGLLRLVAARLSPLRRTQILNSLAPIDWPQGSLAAQFVTLGHSTSVLLQPHQGEFDFAAVLGGDLSYEMEVFQFLDGRVMNYDAVIEIGSNVGLFTLYFASKFAEGGVQAKTIYAFEPSRKAHTRLLQNLEANLASNVITFNCAVGDATRIAWFYEPEGHLTNGSLVSDFAGIFSAQVIKTPVQMMHAAELNQLLEGTKKVLIKIDAEGYEGPILGALKPVINAFSPDIIVEVLPEFEEAINQAVAAVAPNYRSYAITPDGILSQTRVASLGGRDCFLTATEL